MPLTKLYMGRPLWSLYFVVNLKSPTTKWASSSSAWKPHKCVMFVLKSVVGNYPDCKAWNMDNTFYNNSNILLLIILKNPTNSSTAWNFESFSNAVYCDTGQFFISNWYEINFIRCCTRWGTGIGTNLERVGVKLFFSPIFLCIKIAA